MTDCVARASMLVHCAPQAAFDAFVYPDTVTRFWLAATSGPLVPDAEVAWRFMVPGATETVKVRAFDSPRRIAFDWSDGLRVELGFQAFGAGSTRVAVTVDGFAGEGAAAEMATATEGFSIVLCDLKTLIETGRSANLVRDKARLIAQSQSEPVGDG